MIDLLKYLQKFFLGFYDEASVLKPTFNIFLMGFDFDDQAICNKNGFTKIVSFVRA